MQCCREFDEKCEKVNKSQVYFLKESLNVYEIYSKKILDTIFGVEQQSPFMNLTFPESAIHKFKNEGNFKGFYIDFHYLGLNGKYKQVFDEKCYPLNELNTIRSLISEKDRNKCDKIILMINNENSKYLSQTKLEKLKTTLIILSNKKNNIKYFTIYLFLYLCQKEDGFEFNPALIESIEDIIIDFIPNLFLPRGTDYKNLFFLAYIGYEMYFFKTMNNSNTYSQKFEKFLKNLAVWYKEQLWIDFIKSTKQIAANPLISIYFSSSKNFMENKSREPVLYLRNVYQFIINVGFYLLKIPFPLFFDIINDINDQNKDVNSSIICEISKDLEGHIFRNYSSKNVSMKNIYFNTDRENMIKKTFRLVLPFLDPIKDKLVNLYLLNKHFYKTFKKAVLKRFLLFNLQSRKTRIFLWISIVECDLPFMAIFDRITSNYTQQQLNFEDNDLIACQIRLDVNRTNFVSHKLRKVLENILLSTASEFSILSYYQGMNYICGFILNYTEDEKTTNKLFNYLICRKMDVHFRNNFSNLKKMLFISEKLICRYNPFFDNILKKNGVETDYYLSSFLLTIFTNSLPQADNIEVIARIFDLLISLGWLGIYKFILYLTLQLNESIMNLKQEPLLVFFKKDVYEKINNFDENLLIFNVSKIAITKGEIRKLEESYENSRFVVDLYWSKYQEKRKSRILEKIQKTGDGSN